MSIPIVESTEVPAQAGNVTELENAVAGVILKSPRARKMFAIAVAVAGVVLNGIAQTVSVLASNHVMAPDPLWLQITWQWFGLVAAFAGVTWHANVK